MKRRNLLGLIGTLAGTTVVGSGAFTSVSADRSVSVSLADDDQALLKLTERGSGRRSYVDGSTVGFDIPSPDEDEYGGTDPEGVGVDSVYRFGEDASHDEAGLFGVENQGTQPVKLYSTQPKGEDVPTITIYDVETGELLTESSPSSPLDVGETLLCGLKIDTHGTAIREEEYDLTITINAVGTDSD